ncbi:hypothetical protein OH492_24205 [Vibrio chagasii]|nr:hypothetical protein [Vibrio chagasii]
MSAVIAGIAGALYVSSSRHHQPPGEFAPLNSIEIVFGLPWAVAPLCFGAIVGVAIINYAKSWFTVEFPEVWLFALGGLFVSLDHVLPTGCDWFVSEKWQQLRKASNSKDAGQSRMNSIKLRR